MTIRMNCLCWLDASESLEQRNERVDNRGDFELYMNQGCE